MRKLATVILALIASLWLAACASLLGPRQVTVPLHQMQEALSRKFPFNNRYLELMDIHIANPKLALQPQTNRLSIGLDAQVAPPFTNRSFAGNFTITGGLRFDPARNAVLLTDPRIEHFSSPGLDPSFSRNIVRFGSLFVEEVLKDTPLYTFQPHDLRMGGTNFLPTKINTTVNGLVVTFEPVR